MWFIAGVRRAASSSHSTNGQEVCEEHDTRKKGTGVELLCSDNTESDDMYLGPCLIHLLISKLFSYQGFGINFFLCNFVSVGAEVVSQWVVQGQESVLCWEHPSAICIKSTRCGFCSILFWWCYGPCAKITTAN